MSEKLAKPLSATLYELAQSSDTLSIRDQLLAAGNAAIHLNNSAWLAEQERDAAKAELATARKQQASSDMALEAARTELAKARELIQRIADAIHDCKLVAEYNRECVEADCRAFLSSPSPAGKMVDVEPKQ